MWIWNIGKSFILGAVVGGLLIFAGLDLKAVVIITLGFSVFVRWLIEEINFIRKSHGSNIEELETEIEEFKVRLEKLEKHKKH